MDRDKDTGGWKIKDEICDRIARMVDRCSGIESLHLQLGSTPSFVLESILPLLAGVPVFRLDVSISSLDQDTR